MVKYILHNEIDFAKWDACIDHSINGLIYGKSYYLNFMSPDWNALVIGDYEAVMPLTWNKRFGIYYLRQPAFTQQLGIFGSDSFKNKETEAFLNKAIELFPFIEINLNFANEYKKASSIKCNLILPLNISFYEIEKSFKSDLLKNIKIAKKNHLVYEPSSEIKATISLFQNTYSKKINYSKENYTDFSNLCSMLQSKGQLFVRKVNAQNGDQLAIAIFLKDKKRIYNIMSTTLPDGRKLKANHFLLFELIKEFAGQNLILDFEGSDVNSINFFYKKFGAIDQPYPFVAINNLNSPQRIIKKLSNVYKLTKKKLL